MASHPPGFHRYYECRRCSGRVTADEFRAKCDRCSGRLRNIAVPRE